MGLRYALIWGALLNLANTTAIDCGVMVFFRSQNPKICITGPRASSQTWTIPTRNLGTRRQHNCCLITVFHLRALDLNASRLVHATAGGCNGSFPGISYALSNFVFDTDILKARLLVVYGNKRMLHAYISLYLPELSLRFSQVG